MTASSACFSTFLNIPTSKIPNPDTPFARIKFPSRTKTHFPHFRPIRSVPDSVSTVDNQPAAASSSGFSSSATTANSASLDYDTVNDDEVKKAESIIGAKVRVKVPLKVYHVPKVPEYELTGKVGILKQYVGVYKGQKISANLPYKVEFVADEILGRNGNPVKVVAHLRDDEFEVLD